MRGELKLVRMARSALSGFFFVSYGLAALPAAPVLMLPIWNGRSVRWIIRFFYKTFVFFARLTRLYRVEIDARTKAQLTECRGKVVVMNHLSLVDICVLMAHLPDSTVVAKSATLRNPFLSMVVKRGFIVNNEDPNEVIESARRALSDGVNVIVFPQGTRGGETLKRGAAHFALAAQADISVFRVSYDPLALAKGQPWWDVGDREIVISLVGAGTLSAKGENTHAAARRLTELIGERIG